MPGNAYVPLPQDLSSTIGVSSPNDDVNVVINGRGVDTDQTASFGVSDRQISDDQTTLPSTPSLTSREISGANQESFESYAPDDSSRSGASLNISSDASEEPMHGFPTRAFVYTQTFFQLPLVVSTICVLPFSWNHEMCDQPLFFWALSYAIVLALSLASSWVVYLVPVPALQSAGNSELRSAIYRFATGVRKPVENFSLIWILVGQVWLQSSETCSDTAPVLVTLSFWLVILGFCYFLLPCIVVVFLLPFLCLCLPCAIRIIVQVFGQSDAFAGKGANQEMIDSLAVKEYHPELFSSNSDNDDDHQCSICLSKYEDGQELRFLPCDGAHHFHKACCDEWLAVNATCPICRHRLFKSSGSSEGDVNAVEDVEQGRPSVPSL